MTAVNLLLAIEGEQLYAHDTQRLQLNPFPNLFLSRSSPICQPAADRSAATYRVGRETSRFQSATAQCVAPSSFLFRRRRRKKKTTTTNGQLNLTNGLIRQENKQ